MRLTRTQSRNAGLVVLGERPDEQKVCGDGVPAGYTIWSSGVTAIGRVIWRFRAVSKQAHKLPLVRC